MSRALAFTLLALLTVLPCSGFAAPPAQRSGVHLDIDWKPVDKLTTDQKLEQALAAVVAIRDQCKAAGDEDQLVKALVAQARLAVSLGRFEEAVNVLRAEARPAGMLPRLAVVLYYAWTLTNYLQRYSWEIGQREHIDNKGTVDLKRWTRDEIVDEALRAYGDVWKRRAELSAIEVDAFTDYLTPNTYPRSVRGTLRDTLSYLIVEQLSEKIRSWRPRSSSELNVSALIAGGSPTASAVRIDDASVDPLARLLDVLDDLEQWHIKAGHPEAALEAHLERARRLRTRSAGYSWEKADATAIRKDLDKRLATFPRTLPWWSTGMGLLAQWVRDDTHDLPEALRIAREGASAHPDSTGGHTCAQIAAAIDAPSYSIASMSSDGARQRSIEVRHRNLPTLYFRAYPLDLVTRLEFSGVLPEYKELRALVTSGKPSAAWQVPLPATTDYLEHRTFVTPPLGKPGLYAIAASPDRSFSSSQSSHIAVTSLVIGDLMLEAREDQPGTMTVTALSGATGRPVAGAMIELRQRTMGYDSVTVDHQKTDALGEVHFLGLTARSSNLVIGQKGGDVAFVDGVNISGITLDVERSSWLVYSDRAIYRPGQTVLAQRERDRQVEIIPRDGVHAAT